VVTGRSRTRSFPWIAVVTACGTLVAAGLLAVRFAGKGVSQETLWRAKLGLLLGLEVAYIAALATTLIAIPTLGFLLLAARRRGARQPQPRLARGLLLGTSLLLGMVLAEAGAWAWRARLERSGVLALANPGPPVRGGLVPESAGSPADVVLPTRFPAPAEKTVTLVVLGESSAEGVPFNLYALSAGSLVRWQLEELLPGRRFQLVNLASSGETLERQHLKLASLAYRPDVLMIYSGHNEFSSRMPWSRDVSHYSDEQDPSRWEAVVARVERASWFCGLIRQAADTCRVAIPPPRGGYRALVDKPAYTPAEFAHVLADFRQRLERITAYAERLRAVPILVIPPANDSGFEPNRSFLPPATHRAEREAFAREFRAARRLEGSDPAAAARRYQSLLDRQPGFAEAHFRLARLLDGQGAWGEAYRHAIAARDHDGLPMRCPTAFQEVYRDVAARHRVILIDGQGLFHAIGRHGLLGDDLFLDAMHPSLRGQIALAQAILHGLRARGALDWPESTPAPILDPARVAAHFGLGPAAWKKLCDWGAMVYDLLSSGSHDPAERLARRRAYEAAARRIAQGEAPEALGLPNVGTPAPVPAVPEAVILTGVPLVR
jgi:hypothetical protein